MYLCQLCEKVFLNKGRFERHFRIQTGQKRKLHIFKHCGKFLSCDSDLEKMQIGEILHKCSICDKTSTCKSNSHNHERRHSEEKNMNVKFVNKVFTMQLLRKHQKMCMKFEISKKYDLLRHILGTSLNSHVSKTFSLKTDC